MLILSQSSVCVDHNDYKEYQDLRVQNGIPVSIYQIVNLNLRIEDDFIRLEDDDTLTMKFIPDASDNNIDVLEANGEYVRFNTSVTIIDNDSELS